MTRHHSLLGLLLAAPVTLAFQPLLRPPPLLPAPELGCHSVAASGTTPRTRTATLLASPQKGFFEGLADKALGELEKQASLAAGQDQNDPTRMGADRAPAPAENLPPARPLPDSFEDSVGVAVDAVAECVADGTTKIIVEFDTSAGDETYNLQSRTLTFVKPFLKPFADAVAPDDDEAAPGEEDTRPPRLQLLFADEGTAAYARNNWGTALPSRVLLQSMPRAQLAEGVEVLVLITPQATEVPAVQRLLAQVDERAPGTLVLVVNPKLIDMQSTGYGLVGRELRDMVTNTFNVAFALKSLVDGATYRVYPGGWSVWREEAAAEGGYELVYSASRRPSGDEVDELLEGPDDGSEAGGGSPFDGLGAFIKGFQAM